MHKKCPEKDSILWWLHFARGIDGKKEIDSLNRFDCARGPNYFYCCCWCCWMSLKCPPTYTRYSRARGPSTSRLYFAPQTPSGRIVGGWRSIVQKKKTSMHLGAIVFTYALSLYSARRVVVQECADFVPDVVPPKDCGSKRFYALHVRIYRAPASHN